jgi:hypothetical protein
MNTIVLAARLSARAMKSDSQKPSPPGIAVRRTAFFERLCRWSMLTLRARTPVEALCERSFGMDCRIKSGNDEGKERKKRIRKRNADRRNWYSAVASATAAPWIAKAHIYRRSTAASRQRDSRRLRLSFWPWDVAGTRFAHPFERALPAPACPNPARIAHPSRSARGLMPKAARARVASPPAGAALVRAVFRECLPDRVRTMGGNAACN